MVQIHELGGRSFLTVQETTAEQDELFFTYTRKAGLHRPMAGPDESPEDFGIRILGQLVEGGLGRKILSLLLVPPALSRRRFLGRAIPTPRAWTPELAEETERFLATLTTPADKTKLQNLILDLLVDFFDGGIGSSRITATFSRDAIPASESDESNSDESGEDPEDATAPGLR